MTTRPLHLTQAEAAALVRVLSLPGAEKDCRGVDRHSLMMRAMELAGPETCAAPMTTCHEPADEHSGAHLCDECEGEDGAHEPGCRSDPDWEPSDDDLDLSGEGVAASREAERRALEDAGR